MQCFKDSNGRTWILAVTIAGVERVEALTGICLIDSKGDPMHRLADDAVLLTDTLYALCKDEATAAGIGREQFELGFNGAALREAFKALTADLLNFFPEPTENEAGSHARNPWQVVYQLAGVAGVNPGPMTLRELGWMSEGRDRTQWRHTSAILAQVVNSNPYRKGKPVKRSDLDPYAVADEARQTPLKMPLSVLTDLIVRDSKRKPR